jgi:hypothetical protein
MDKNAMKHDLSVPKLAADKKYTTGGYETTVFMSLHI